MSEQLAFDYPPDWGNAVALVAYYAVFLVAQIVLAIRFLRRWNWPIFLTLIVFLVLVILGSVAYLKLHYTPFAGSWYSLWVFALSAGPAFFIATVHLCMGQVLRDSRSGLLTNRFPQLSPRAYTVTCLAIDGLSLVLTIIGSAYAGAKSSVSTPASQPGFNVVVAAMAVQLCGLTIMVVTGIQATISFRSHRCTDTHNIQLTDEVKIEAGNKADLPWRTVKRPRIVLGTLLTVGVLLFTQTVVRAVDVAGGFDGSLRLPVLPNVEAILLFVAILVMTAIHPAVHLQELAMDMVEK